MALSFSVTVKFAYTCDRSVSDHDLGARGEVLADFDVADAEFAVERRAHQLLRNDRLGLGDAGIGLVERRLR